MENNRNVRTYTLFIDLSQFTEKTVPRLRELFTHWLTKARWHQPSIMIFDNIDHLMPPQAENTDSSRTRHIVETFIGVYATTFRSIPTNFRGVVMIGTAKSSAVIHPLLKQLHVFEDTINVLPPNKEARKEILSHFVEQRIIVSDLTKDESLNYAALATLTEGYAALDLKDLVSRAVQNAAERSLTDADGRLDYAAPRLTYRDFTAAQEDFVPLSLRDVGLQKSTVSWADIGGLKETKKVLRETLEWPTKYARIFAQSPLRLRSGLLLYGYPGCGKTMLASAVAKECGLNFISVKGPEILNKYIGASEKSVRDLFERATAAKPCVLFFDEFDSIAPKRGHDSTGVTDRVVNQMLTQMDGAEGLEGVYVLAATSRPDLIDSALLRPGRLDKSLLCDMPSQSDRKETLETLRKKVTLADDVDLEAIARATDGFTGADLQALVYNANLEAVHETIDEKPLGNASGTGENSSIPDESQKIQHITFGPEGSETKVLSAAEETAIQRQLRQIYSSTSKRVAVEEKIETPRPSKPVVRAEHLRRVLKTTRPSVSPQEIQRLRAIYDTFDQDRSGGMPVPPESTAVGTRVSLQ
ncbi:AAA-domain-containing protein [Thelephora ganbajun]|uniref:AAA-domain-containing protein n=1 Tax=Thelephora ganbajun TaxID=370292 RepID=A0ACB6ZG14_THEGA|nr:AAA-domain-containing protein [Thelephora ganbajun]